ncbi:hypothetical protein OPV22_015498 [Ensete ventricosum]|uniref:Uncharacterized protein n=1 Tax=Ensete ventricosum TaxID=4639 RepID=A0AAV8R0B1_ENSVE|nr:hypothetical protein OPV22_015498 [Ensete ventricosum]
MDGYVVCGSSFGRRWNARHTSKHLEVVVVDGCVEEGPSLCVALMPPVRMDESEINSCTYLRRQRNEDNGAVVGVDTYDVIRSSYKKVSQITGPKEQLHRRCDVGVHLWLIFPEIDGPDGDGKHPHAEQEGHEEQQNPPKKDYQRYQPLENS